MLSGASNLIPLNTKQSLTVNFKKQQQITSHNHRALTCDKGRIMFINNFNNNVCEPSARVVYEVNILTPQKNPQRDGCLIFFILICCITTILIASRVNIDYQSAWDLGSFNFSCNGLVYVLRKCSCLHGR